MSLLDWFRPRHRHSDPEVRRQAIEALVHPDTLAAVARQDPLPALRQLALERAEDRALLEERAEQDPDADVRAWAQAQLRPAGARGVAGSGAAARKADGAAAGTRGEGKGDEARSAAGAGARSAGGAPAGASGAQAAAAGPQGKGKHARGAGGARPGTRGASTRGDQRGAPSTPSAQPAAAGAPSSKTASTGAGPTPTPSAADGGAAQATGTGSRKSSKKARKHTNAGGLAASGAAPQRAEVLSREEAERRFGALLQAPAAPGPGTPAAGGRDSGRGAAASREPSAGSGPSTPTPAGAAASRAPSAGPGPGAGPAPSTPTPAGAAVSRAPSAGPGPSAQPSAPPPAPALAGADPSAAPDAAQSPPPPTPEPHEPEAPFTPRSRRILSSTPAEEPTSEPTEELPTGLPHVRTRPAPERQRPRDGRDDYRAWAVRPRFDALLAELDTLAQDPTLRPRELLDRRRALLDEWRSLGRPPEDAAPALQQAREARLAALEERLAALRELERGEEEANLARKQALLEQAQAAAELPDLAQAEQALRALQGPWREVGPVPRAAVEGLNQALDATFARLRARRAAEREATRAAESERLGRLQRIVQQAEALAQSPDRVAATERIKSLQAEWKKVGRAGRREEFDALWQRLRAASDTAFTALRESRAQQEQDNRARKEALITRALALAEDPEQRDPEGAVRALHAEWKKIGHVPRAEADALWARFRAACDTVLHPPSAGGAGEQAPLRYNPFAGLGEG